MRSTRARSMVSFGLLVLLSGALAAALATLESRRGKAPDFALACQAGTPFYVASSFRGQSSRGRHPDPCYASPEGGMGRVDIGGNATPVTEPVDQGALASAVVVDLAADEGRVLAADVGAQVAPATDPRSDLWSRMHIWGIEGPPLVAEGLAGVHVLDATGRRVGAVFSPSLVEGGAVDERHGVLYLADGHAGVLVLDLQQPDSPTLVHGVRAAGAAHSALLHDGALYVAAGPAGVHRFDVETPRAPTLAETWDTPGEALAVAATRGELYVADGEAGLRVLDRASGGELGAYDSPGYAWDVMVLGSVAYLSDRQGGLAVLDVSDPRAPRVVVTLLEGEGQVMDAETDGERLWVAAGPGGLFALDIADPMAPRPVAQMLLDDRALGVMPADEGVYAAAGTGGVRLVALEDDTLAERTRWTLPGTAERLIDGGRFLYVAAELGGLQVLDRGGGAARRLAVARWARTSAATRAPGAP